MEVPGATPARVTETSPPSNNQAPTKNGESFAHWNQYPQEHELILSWHLRNGGRREENKGGAARTPPREVCSYWIFTAKMITADWVGVRVPTVAVIVPAVPLAGAVTVPTVVLAAGLFVYTVNAGVGITYDHGGYIGNAGVCRGKAIDDARPWHSSGSDVALHKCPSNAATGGVQRLLFQQAQLAGNNCGLILRRCKCSVVAGAGCSGIDGAHGGASGRTNFDERVTL